MAGLTIGWEYLTGYAVATDPSNRERAEWPPHPARVFMAMAAAWFETAPGAGGSDEDRREHESEGDALRWLEGLGDPELWLPPSEKESERTSVTVYVPVNDKAGPAAATLQSAPALTRSKQARTFPRRYIGATPSFLSWAEADGVEEHHDALARLCAKVTRIGHSSSLVCMWVATSNPDENARTERFVPDDALARLHTRRISPGFLAHLDDQFGEGPRAQTMELKSRISELESEQKIIKGKGTKARKAEVDQRLAPLHEELAKLAVHEPVRPRISLWTGYRRADDGTESECAHSHFDTELLILTHASGPQLPVVSTLAVCAALRGAVMQHCPQPVPEWVSGHKPDGSPSEDEGGHLAIIPLPFVGDAHADGHLLGLAMAFPQDVDRRERGRMLGPLMVARTGEPRAIKLQLGRLGEWVLRLSGWDETRRSLAPEIWTASPSGERVWASVTPVVLDQFSKTDRAKDREGWEQEVRGIVARACTRIELPEPISIDIDTTCWHLGSPRALGKRRLLRDGSGRDVGFGNGFPAHPTKRTNAPRPQIHVWLDFGEPVAGPVLLGAGRYRGYGLCKPWSPRREAER